MKKALITILLFFIFLSTFSQNSFFKRKINWKSPKQLSYYYNLDQKNLNKKDYLYFDNACYYDHKEMLPYYFELIPVNSKNKKAELINLRYETLSNDEIKILAKTNMISDNISYNQNIKLSRNKYYLQLDILPFRKNMVTGQYEKLIEFDINLVESSQIKSAPIKALSFSTTSVLKNGNWYKIRLKNDGLYKITYSELENMGFNNPENLRIFGNSQGMLPISNTEEFQDDLAQHAIYFEKGSDGIFNTGDYVLFYSKGPNKWVYDEENDFYNCINHIYSNYNYFFLTTDIGSLHTINNSPTPVGSIEQTITKYTDYSHYEKNLVNLIESGQEWYGENFDITTTEEFDFEFPNLDLATPIKIKLGLVARSSVSSSFTVSHNGVTITNPTLGSVNMSSYTSSYATKAISTGSFSNSNDNISINIEYNKPTSSSEGWLDFITLNAQRELKIESNPLEFRIFNQDIDSKIIEFIIDNATTETKVWDITESYQPKNIETNYSNNSISIKVEIQPGLNEFIAFNTSGFKSVEVVEAVENQNLHGTTHKDMLIITHPEFIDQANELKQLHEEIDNLDILVTTPEVIYNEFSSGTRDVTAIRNFIKMVYNRPSISDTLKYVLLIGDGSYDHKSTLASNINYIPTYQSKNSLNPVSSFVTDDFFGLLDDSDNIENSNSGLVDIGIGRLPVKSATEAQLIVNKIRTYTNPENWGDWLNQICFVGDDEDNNIHMIDADNLASFVDTTYPHFFIKKIYLDAFPQESSANFESYPEVNRLINDAINNGILIFNYTGHGGENGLAHERIVSVDDINSWVNSKQLPVFVTATCEFSRFDNHKYTSAGEYVILNPKGGSIALFSTTRLVYSSPNYTLNRNFYNFSFEKDYKGNYWALGDIIRLAKNNSGTENNKRNFTLLGDPALKMPVPELNIITDSINHFDAEVYTDTLKALSKVTIHGHVENTAKSIVSDYNGIVYPMVLDKQKTITTLSNDGDPQMEFQLQNNILYKGKSSILDGKFNYTFLVPKDISYNFDKGKINYYASGTNGSNAKGYFTNFIIGGSNPNAAIDNIGPNIILYMNNEDFVSGGVTDENPKLHAILNDSSGINTVGSGIGHDISAILDENSTNLILLNDYYEADIDDYQNGKIEYIFSELDNGNHSLKVKVWDVYNNSSEKEIEFIVAESEKLAIKNIFNYPNPFTENTAFYFDHNRPNEDLDVLIHIFTISGKLVKTINITINSEGFRSSPIHWNGLDDFGDNIGRGVYIYQIKVKSTDGDTVKEIEKLVILK